MNMELLTHHGSLGSPSAKLCTSRWWQEQKSLWFPLPVRRFIGV